MFYVRALIKTHIKLRKTTYTFPMRIDALPSSDAASENIDIIQGPLLSISQLLWLYPELFAVELVQGTSPSKPSSFRRR